ncbi:predicted protein [Plenodomus lingam JN3]|uniref:Predicted protein n=1 Tax=Leptosphaeria maculans (strain JN3 / isolate v23.1.3 / race Av1-4-5-6-7-8) TaxID=985895 RepID=E4ZNE8_LEPMJ|nr:predicted protein [Plenodomus lingam JN3]CBX93007.1 predicted protein [Plenodomus lingam JN3]
MQSPYLPEHMNFQITVFLNPWLRDRTHYDIPDPTHYSIHQPIPIVKRKHFNRIPKPTPNTHLEPSGEQ